MSEEWEKFGFVVGQGSSRELTTVRHVVHVQFARRIIEDGKIKAGLIYDESRLNKSRISVAWVSANTWGLGSIYGTVEFQFNWTTLFAGQKIYWVEAMDYNPKAYRFLLSKREILTGAIKLYDPQKDNGPLLLKDGKYYWNGDYTSEFMIEDDLPLDWCTGIDFVMHHAQYCRTFGNNCVDKQQQPSIQRTSGRLLSFILGNDLHALDQLFHTGNQFSPLNTGYVGLPAPAAFIGPISADADCQDMVRGALALYGADQFGQARTLLRLIASKEAYRDALREVIRSHFADADWDLPDS
jgi:hypothetical protein